MYMIWFYQIFIFLLCCKNSISKVKSFEDIILEKNSKIIKNEELKIRSIEFRFLKSNFQIKKVLKEMFELHNIFKSGISSSAFKTWASITIYDHHQIKKIREDEVTKIIRCISECRENEMISYRPNSVFKLDCLKIDINIKDNEFFDLLPEHEEFCVCEGENYIPCTYYFLIYEDISKNDLIRKSMGIKLNSFFKNHENKLYECKDTFISLIGSYRNSGIFLLKEISLELNNYKEINMHTTRILLSYYKIIDEPHYFLIKKYNLRLYKEENKESFDQKSIKKKKVFNKLYKIDRNKEKKYLLNYFIFSTYNIFFEIKKVIYEMDTGEKLLNFLGYSPIINKFHICLSSLKDCKIKMDYDVLILIEKTENFLYNYKEKQEKYFTKKIIISRVLEDDCTEIINFSYNINNEELVGFPLTLMESLEVEKLSEGNNLEAKKLLNFINSYQSFVFGITYFYFYSYFDKELCFTEKICFFRREVLYNDISNANMIMLISNLWKFKYNISMARKHTILNNVKSINIFHFERKILNNLNSKVEKHYHNVLKGLKNHFIDQIELKFYDNVKNFNPSHLSRDNTTINFFINIDFGLNREYLIIFKESSYKNTGCKEFYDIKFLHEKVFETLGSDFLKILPSLDINSLKNQLKLFTNSILEIIKEDLFDNIEIEDGLCIKLKSEINCFAPILHETILNYCNVCDDIENKKINDRDMKKNIIFERILNELILIIRKSFLGKRYESCVLASLANEKNESDMILQSLLLND